MVAAIVEIFHDTNRIASHRIVVATVRLAQL
jgi:hypothetical protein